MHKQFQGKTVLVTGGSGFIGGRLVEVLHRDAGAKVRAIVNNPANALRMARLGVEFVLSDITSPEAMAAAVEGCDYVFHCAYGKSGDLGEQRRVTVEGTRVLASAAQTAGVSRFVNLSTAAVYGITPDGVADETLKRDPAGWHYGVVKLEAEKVLEEMGRSSNLPFTTLQLVGVYGPWGEVFTIGPLKQLASGRVVLVNDGTGLVNATYVDDVIRAMLLAAISPKAVGKTFLIKGKGRVTRRQFAEAYAAMLGVEDAFVGMSPQEIRKQVRLQRSGNLRRLLPSAANSLRFDASFREAFAGSKAGSVFQTVRKWLPEAMVDRLKGTPPLASDFGGDANVIQRPLIFPAEMMIPRLAAKTEFNCNKARELIGYEPKFDLDTGMKLTKEWAQWAGLLEMD
ncbi:NAD-dependent epimerase/dehydratase family protein [Akkermansiaceae bacterium]|nr:NAD-dependent epimerase/dehydratase family protein [Akkermansiaceae bacterium]MDA7936077.1 NAD-dependent epimerase/dehydratase family protein [bacterium]